MGKKKNPSMSGMTSSEQAPSPAEHAGSPRRKTLKTLLAGGAIAGIPTQWGKPVVDSVVLPVHAQSTPGPGPCGGSGGPCTSGMNVNILFAELVGGDLIVVGDTQIPADEGCGLGPSDEPPTWTEPQLICALLDNNGLIASETFDSAGGGCNDDSATAVGCLVSCSVSLGSGEHSVSSGDCITLRFIFAGGCVCSEVTTVS